MFEPSSARGRRLLSKRELWSIAGEAASREILASAAAAETHNHHRLAPGPLSPADGVPSNTLVAAPAAEHGEHAEDGHKADGPSQAMTRALDVGLVTSIAAPVRRMGGRPLDAGRVLEIAKDPVTGCATKASMRAESVCM